MKVVGIVNSRGDYEGRPYHNLVFQVEVENENPNKDCVGLLTDVVKLRYSDINCLLGLGLADQADVEKLKASDFESEFLGAEIEVAYNKYAAVQSIKVVKSPEKAKTGESAAPSAVHAEKKP